MFVKPLLDAPELPWTLRNTRNGLVLAQHIEAAFDSTTRRQGLLGREGLDAGAALIIAPSNSIHTFFMKFAIDTVFAARDGRVVKVCQSLPPWRIAIAWKAFAVVELPADTITRTGTQVGDSLQIVR